MMVAAFTDLQPARRPEQQHPSAGAVRCHFALYLQKLEKKRSFVVTESLPVSEKDQQQAPVRCITVLLGAFCS